MFDFDEEEEISYVVNPNDSGLLADALHLTEATATEEAAAAASNRSRFLHFLTRRRTPALSDTLAVIGLRSALLVGMLSSLGGDEGDEEEDEEEEEMGRVERVRSKEVESAPASLMATQFDEVNDADAENDEDDESSNTTTTTTEQSRTTGVQPLFTSSRSGSLGLMESPKRSTPPIVRKIRRGTTLNQPTRAGGRTVSMTTATSTSSPSSDEPSSIGPSLSTSSSRRGRSKSVSVAALQSTEPSTFSSPEASFASQTFNADAPRIRVKDLLKIPLHASPASQRRKSVAVTLKTDQHSDSARKTSKTFGDESAASQTTSRASMRRRHSAAPMRLNALVRSETLEATLRRASVMVETDNVHGSPSTRRGTRGKSGQQRRVMFSEQSQDKLQVPSFKVWQTSSGSVPSGSWAPPPSPSSSPASKTASPTRNAPRSMSRTSRTSSRGALSTMRANSESSSATRSLRRQKHVDRTQSDEDTASITERINAVSALKQHTFCSSCALSLSRLSQGGSESEGGLPTVVMLDSADLSSSSSSNVGAVSAARRGRKANTNAAKVTDV